MECQHIKIFVYQFDGQLISPLTGNISDEDFDLFTPFINKNISGKYVFRKEIDYNNIGKNSGFFYQYGLSDTADIAQYKLLLTEDEKEADLHIVITYSATNAFTNDLKQYTSNYLGSLIKFRRGLGANKTENSALKISYQKPIITICPTDFLNLFFTSDQNNIDEKGCNHPDNIDLFRDTHILDEKIDKRAYFLDHSIWHRFSPIGPYFFEAFSEVVWDICYCLGKEIDAINFFSTTGAKEYLEFSLRLLANSYIVEPNDSNGSGHSTHINPFVFHSETIAKRNTKRTLIKSFAKGQTILKWRICVLDDKPDKIKILKQILKRFSPHVIDNSQTHTTVDKIKDKQFLSGKLHFEIERFATIKELLAFQATYVFDVFLLDYLLGDQKQDQPESSGRSYGIDFFNNIKILDEVNDLKHPFDKFWLFQSSVFNEAFFSAIKQRSINPIDQDFYLHYGEDPVNKPFSFVHHFLIFLDTQLSEVLLDGNKMAEYFLRFVYDVLKSKNKKGEEFTPKYINANDLENEARVKLNYFIYEFGTFEMLANDAKKGSLIAESLRNINNPIEELLFSRIRNLFYVLAYRGYENVAELMNAIQSVCDLIQTNETLEISSEFENIRDLKEFRSKVITLISLT